MGFSNWFRKKPPVVQLDESRQYFSLPADTLERDAAAFVALLETEESASWCLCLWRVHPDDQGVRLGHCRKCNEDKKNHTLKCGHSFAGIRKLRVDDHPTCPVHTREGLLAAFVRWNTDGR